MNITEQILHSPDHPSTDVRGSSQGKDYPLGAIVRREYDEGPGTYTGRITYEGWHAGTNVRTGIIRYDREAAVADIREQLA